MCIRDSGVTGRTPGPSSRHARCTTAQTMVSSVRVSTVVVTMGLASFVSACAEDGADGGAADIQGEDKADGTVGIEVTARIRPGSVDGELSTKVPRRGYVFY